MTDTATIAALTARFPEAKTSEFRGTTRAVVPAKAILEALEFLKNQRRFDFLVDITCVDYLHYRGAEDRFGLVYFLTSTETNERITLRTFLNEPELTVPSAVSLWEGANWMEREVYDMFGITLRRPSRPAADPAAGRIHRLSAPQRLSAARPRRAAQFPRVDERKRLTKATADERR